MAGTWVWLMVYAIVPVLLAVQWWQQWRAPGVDPIRSAPLPGWLRTVLIVHALIMIVSGIVGTLAPTVLAAWWAWQLTPLTARAVGAWCVGLGIAAGHAAYEDDLTRILPAMASYAVFGLLALVALARYPDAAGWDWGSGRAWGYVAFIVSLMAVGAAGVVLARRRPAN